jgi:phage gp46-like protein
MPDIRIVQAVSLLGGVKLGWGRAAQGPIDETQALATAVIIALGTDRLAQPDDTLPTLNSTDRRGWWGDLDSQTIWNGWPVGSRLWEMSRDKITDARAKQGSTLAKAERFIREAIQPFVDQRIASAMDVKVTRTGEDRISAVVTLFRASRPAVALEFADLWTELGA